MEYLIFLQNLRNGSGAALTPILYYLSEIMGGAVGVMIPAAIYWCVDKYAGSYMAMSFSFSFLINQTVKNIFCVYRPMIRDSRIKPYKKALKSATGYSFPSGHSNSAASIYGGIAVWQKKRKWVVVICILMTLLTAFARNWFGVHTLQDVCVGMLIACAALWGCAQIVKYLEHHPEKDGIFLLCGTIVGIVVLLFTNFKAYPMEYTQSGALLVDPFEMKTDCFRACGIFLGFLWGWWIERKFVKFEVEGSKKQKILRFVFGVILTLAVYVGILPILTKPFGEHMGKFLKYLLTFLFMMAGYPSLFKYVESRKHSAD